MRETFTVESGSDDRLAGWREGSGPPVLLLHGGPGLSHDYMEPMVADIGPGYEIASYQQRGLPPSATTPTTGVDQEVGDVIRVLDHLGWSEAWLVGHSWGGHLALHVAATCGDRLFGALAVDPLGAVGDGGMAEFSAEMYARADDEARRELNEIDERTKGSAPSDSDMVEQLRLLWPSYFADPRRAPPMPAIAVSAAAYASVLASALAALPVLEASLPTITVPIGILAGGRSPIPIAQARASAERIPGSWIAEAPQAGHFVWHEEPGCVRHALHRLTSP